MIELKDIYKIYSDGDSEIRALDGINLNVDEGEFVAIVGQSGSGKSTAMNIIGCLDVPTSGKYYLDGEDVSGLIRTNEISMAASDISKLPCVRAKADALSKHLAATKNVIMEGRDIGTIVIPDAEVKIFMTAAPEVRAKRRYLQLLDAGKPADYDQIFDEIQKRDYQDSHRDYHPLKQADDAVLLDTSNMTKEENIEAVIDLIREKTGEEFAGLHAASE